MTLDIGVRVRLVGRNDDGNIYSVCGVETHGDMTFYRLRGLSGALFLQSSLEVVREH